MMTILLALIYLLTFVLNYYILSKLNFAKEQCFLKYNIIYFLLSPITLLFTINDAFNFWRETIILEEAFLAALINTLKGTKYEDIDNAEIRRLYREYDEEMLNKFDECGDWVVVLDYLKEKEMF